MLQPKLEGPFLPTRDFSHNSHSLVFFFLWTNQIQWAIICTMASLVQILMQTECTYFMHTNDKHQMAMPFSHHCAGLFYPALTCTGWNDLPGGSVIRAMQNELCNTQAFKEWWRTKSEAYSFTGGYLAISVHYNANDFQKSWTKIDCYLVSAIHILEIALSFKKIDFLRDFAVKKICQWFLDLYIFSKSFISMY